MVANPLIGSMPPTYPKRSNSLICLAGRTIFSGEMPYIRWITRLRAAPFSIELSRPSLGDGATIMLSDCRTCRIRPCNSWTDFI